MQCHVVSVDGNDRGIIIGISGIGGSGEISRHLIVRRHIVGIPRQLYGLEVALRADVGTRCHVAHVHSGIDAEGTIGNAALQFGMLRDGLSGGTALLVGDGDIGTSSREIAAAGIGAVGLVPYDKDVVDGADGIALDAARTLERS